MAFQLRRAVLGALSASFALVTATPAFAADAPDTPAGGSGQLDEIVVTSQKMAEGVSNQDVPAAITAFDAGAIERNFARGERWQVSLFGKNLTDEEYIDFAADVGTLGSWVFGGEPRRYGVEFRASFR
jgi:outer membrane receptor protein involved in Fe transport